MEIQNYDYEQYRRQIQGSKPVLVDFWAPWCTYCRRIAPAVEKMAEQVGDRITIAKLNIDEVPQAAAEAKVDVIPTLILYRDGRALGTIVAPESKAKIEEFLRQTLGE